MPRSASASNAACASSGLIAVVVRTEHASEMLAERRGCERCARVTSFVGGIRIDVVDRRAPGGADPRTVLIPPGRERYLIYGLVVRNDRPDGVTVKVSG